MGVLGREVEYSKKGGLESEGEGEGLSTIRRGWSIMKRGRSTLRLVVRVVEDWGENEMLWDECWLTTGRVLENSGRCLELLWDAALLSRTSAGLVYPGSIGGCAVKVSTLGGNFGGGVEVLWEGWGWVGGRKGLDLGLEYSRGVAHRSHRDSSAKRNSVRGDCQFGDR